MITTGAFLSPCIQSIDRGLSSFNLPSGGNGGRGVGGRGSEFLDALRVKQEKKRSGKKIKRIFMYDFLMVATNG
jgi:hypothetical protein